MKNIFRKTDEENFHLQVTVDENVDELKKEIALLKGIQSAMPDPYYVRDMDYNIVLWSDAIAEITGYSAEEARRLKCYDMFRACVCPPHAQCPTQGCVVNRQFLRDVAVDVYRKDGAIMHALVSNAGVYDENGIPIGAVEVVKNNTNIQNLKSFVESATEQLDAETSAHVKESIQKVNDSMTYSYEKMKALKEKSEAIIGIVNIIENISFRTNLLALNALVEAAHAGDAGKGFNVVADEVKKLADNSNESASSIKDNIEEIKIHIEQVTSALDATAKDFKASSEGTFELLEFVNELMEKFNSLRHTNMG